MLAMKNLCGSEVVPPNTVHLIQKKLEKKYFGFPLVEKEQKPNSGNNFGRVTAKIGHGIVFVSHQPFDCDVIEPKMNLEKCHRIAASHVTNMNRNQHFLNVT